jgi:hypothetical protein
MYSPRPGRCFEHAFPVVPCKRAACGVVVKVRRFARANIEALDGFALAWRQFFL